MLLRSGKTIEELIDGNSMPFEIRQFYRRKLALPHSFDFLIYLFFSFPCFLISSWAEQLQGLVIEGWHTCILGLVRPERRIFLRFLELKRAA